MTDPQLARELERAEADVAVLREQIVLAKRRRDELRRRVYEQLRQPAKGER